MQKTALPKKYQFQKGDNDNRGNIIIDPCYPGFGLTLGNALRRVLLSSLPGAAPVGIKIEGASHEFATLPHLKEDMLEFMLNIKQVRLKVFSEETVKLKLEAHGEKEVKAGDIEKNSSVEIMNPELVLGQLTDMAGSLKVEIYVKQGLGYDMIENRKTEEKETGYIEIDSIFSPILSVGLKVENVRVGKMTNWDKLILDITTDGTITPEQAFIESAKILINQFNAAAGNNLEDTEDLAIKEEEASDAEKDINKEEEKEIEAEKDLADKTEEPEIKEKKKRGRPKKIEE